MVELTRSLENELVTEVELDTGIRTGYVSGFSYQDDKGNTRNKFQTLSTMSSNGIKQAIIDKNQLPPIDGEPTPEGGVT